MNITATETTPARRVSVLRITPEADHKSNNLLLQGNFLFGENNNFVAGLDYWDRSYYGFRQKNQLVKNLYRIRNTEVWVYLHKMKMN